MTYADSYEQCQTITGDTTAASLLQFKSDINLGNKRFNDAINSYFTRRSRSTNMVADQQYYQLPKDCIRVIGVDAVITSDRRRPLRHVHSEYQWRQLNYTARSSNWTDCFFIKGADEIGLFPTPSDDLTKGLIIYYEPRGAYLTQPNYTIGTVAVTQGSATVTGTGTTFTDLMVGSELSVDSDPMQYSYRIAARSSSTVVTLEEPFIGLSQTGVTYKIGSSFAFPDTYHDAPMDYALSRYFEMKNNPQRASYHLDRFNTAVREAREKYASSSSDGLVFVDDINTNPWGALWDNTVEPMNGM